MRKHAAIKKDLNVMPQTLKLILRNNIEIFQYQRDFFLL